MIKVGFINPIVSPETIAEGLKKYNLHSTAIFTALDSPSPEWNERVKPELFDEVIFLKNNDINSAINQLKTQNLNFLFYGYDTTEITDQLAQAICPTFANSPATSKSRYDKSEFTKIFQSKNLPTPKTLTIHEDFLTRQQKDELSHWHYPLIVKPATANGTIGYVECHNLAEIEKNLANKIEAVFSNKVHSYLIQERLIGTEYAVDTFSLQGKHQLIHIRAYEKFYFNGKTPINRRVRAIFPSEPVWEQIKQYIEKMLSAVEFNNGFCHTELFVTQTGIFTVDINPRLPGGANSSCGLTQETYGFNHLDVMCNVLLKNKTPQPNYKKGMLVYLHNHQPRQISAVNLEKMQTLPSFKKCYLNKKPGTFMNLPNGVSDTIAFTLFAHDNQQQLDLDYQAILTMEKNQELF